MRLADADLLPFEFGDFAETIQKYVHELEALANTEREEIVERNREIEEDVCSTPPPIPGRNTSRRRVETVPPYLNLAPLENSAVTLTRSAEHYTQAWEKSGAARGEMPSPEVSPK